MISWLHIISYVHGEDNGLGGTGQQTESIIPYWFEKHIMLDARKMW